jgi:hypothetical protein
MVGRKRKESRPKKVPMVEIRKKRDKKRDKKGVKEGGGGRYICVCVCV